MDLHLIPDAIPTAAEHAALDHVLGHGVAVDDTLSRSLTQGHALRSQRHLLLPALQALQSHIGYISPGGMNALCTRLGVPPAEAHAVASFYALLSLKPAPPVVAHVCDDIACRCAGALALCDALERRLGPAGEPAFDGRVTWHRSPCLGQCDRAPAVFVQQAGETPVEVVLAPANTPALLQSLLEGPTAVSEWDPAAARRAAPQSTDPTQAVTLQLLQRVGNVDPTNLDAYRASGGYAALRRAIDLQPDGVIREVQDARLMGRGGAAFPTGRKWQDVARATANPHYVICNADESEPGTFKDRLLMEEDPFALIEALTIAGYTTGSARGYIYVRNEYPLATSRLQHAIEQAHLRGFLGANVMDSGFAFEIEIRRGGGAYICGEETALFNSIEGYRGEPRNKPPFPTISGLFRKPTLVNNVETFCNIPLILNAGGSAYAQVGTTDSTGTRLFCLAGHIAKPGVYEAPFGITLRELIALAGGVTGGNDIQAILLGGAAGTFVTAEDLDLRLTFEDTRAAGASLGSGVVMLFNETVNMPDILLRIAAFFRDESCGKCVPCRVGTVRQQEALQRLIHNHRPGDRADDLMLLQDVGQVMRDASICGLGQTAAGAILSAIDKLALFQPTPEVTA